MAKEKDVVEEENVEWVEANGKIDVDKSREEKNKKIEWVEMDGEKLNVDKSKHEVRAEIAQQSAQPSFIQKLLTAPPKPQKAQEQKPIVIKVQAEKAQSAPAQTREERIQGRINWLKQAAGKIEGQQPKGVPSESAFNGLSMGGGMMMQGFNSGGEGMGLGSMLMSGGTPASRRGRQVRMQRQPKATVNPMVLAMMGGARARGRKQPRVVKQSNSRMSPVVAAMFSGGTSSRPRQRAVKSAMNPMVKVMMGGKIRNKKRWF